MSKSLTPRQQQVASLAKEIKASPSYKAPEKFTNTPEFRKAAGDFDKRNGSKIAPAAPKQATTPRTGNNMTPGYKASAWR